MFDIFVPPSITIYGKSGYVLNVVGFFFLMYVLIILLVNIRLVNIRLGK